MRSTSELYGCLWTVLHSQCLCRNPSSHAAEHLNLEIDLFFQWNFIISNCMVFRVLLEPSVPIAVTGVEKWYFIGFWNLLFHPPSRSLLFRCVHFLDSIVFSCRQAVSIGLITTWCHIGDRLCDRKAVIQHLQASFYDLILLQILWNRHKYYSVLSNFIAVTI